MKDDCAKCKELGRRCKPAHRRPWTAEEWFYAYGYWPPPSLAERRRKEYSEDLVDRLENALSQMEDMMKELRAVRHDKWQSLNASSASLPSKDTEAAERINADAIRLLTERAGG